jgi:hypothetical protein
MKSQFLYLIIEELGQEETLNSCEHCQGDLKILGIIDRQQGFSELIPLLGLQKLQISLENWRQQN